MTLLDCELPLISILKIFSNVVFYYDSKCFKISKLTNIYCFCLTMFLQGFYWFMSSLNYTSMAAKFDEGSKTTEMIHLLVCWSLELGLFPILVNAFLNQKNQVKLLNKILKIEDSIKSLKYQLNQKQCYRKFQVAANLSMVSAITYFIVLIYIFMVHIQPEQHEAYFKNMFIELFHTLLAILFNLITIFMVFLVKIIIFLFQQLNFNIEKQISDVSALKKNANFKEIVQLLKIQQKLKKTMLLFSKSFGLACLGIFLHNVGMVTCVVFLQYITLRDIDLFVSWEIIVYDIVNMIWSVPLIISFGILARECEKVVLEAEKGNFLLDKIYSCRNKEINALVISTQIKY